MIIKKTTLALLISSMSIISVAHAQQNSSQNEKTGVIMGDNAVNNGKHGISIGNRSKNNSKGGISIGNNALNEGNPDWRPITSEYSKIIRVPVVNEDGLVEYIIKKPDHKTEKDYGYGIAIGNSSKNNYSGVAMGDDAINDGEFGVAIGRESKNDGDNSISIGNKSRTTNNDNNVVSVGNEEYTYQDYSDAFYIGGKQVTVNSNKRKIIHVADGDISENSHEVITGAQLFTLIEKVSKNEKVLEELNLVKDDILNNTNTNNTISNGSQDISSLIKDDETIKNIQGNINANIINIESNATKITNLSNTKVDKAEFEATNQLVTKNKTDIANIQNDMQSQSKQIDANSVGIAQNREDIKELRKYTNIGISNVAAMSGYDFSSIKVGNRGIGVGVAHHGNAQAVSVGMGYRPNEDIVIGGKLATNTKDVKNVTVSIGGMYEF